MKKQKQWFYVGAVVAMLVASCSNDDDPVIISKAQLEGNWYECYDTNLLQMDGSIDYKFSQNGTYEVSVYDVFSNTTTTSTHSYVLQNDLLVLRSELPVAQQDSFQIVTYKNNEMAWQRVGTTYSIGTWSSDYKHFKRSK